MSDDDGHERDGRPAVARAPRARRGRARPTAIATAATRSHCETDSIHSHEKPAVAAERMLDIGLRPAALARRRCATCAKRQRTSTPTTADQPADDEVHAIAAPASPGSRKMPDADHCPDDERERHPQAEHAWARGSARSCVPSPALAIAARGLVAPPFIAQGQTMRAFIFPGRGARPSAWAQRWPRRAAPRTTCSTKSTRRSARTCSG